MDAPDEMVEAVAQALDDAAGAIDLNLYPSELASTTLARAVLSVPSVAEAIARDAKAREIVAEFFAPEPHRSAGKPMRANNAFHDIAALYREAGQ